MKATRPHVGCLRATSAPTPITATPTWVGARPSRGVAGQADDGHEQRHHQAEHEHEPEGEADRVDQRVEEAADHRARDGLPGGRDEGATGRRDRDGDDHHDERQSHAEALERGSPLRRDRHRGDGCGHGEDPEQPDQLLQEADGVAGLLDLGHRLAVGQDDLLVDVAQVDLAGDVEAAVDEALLEVAQHVAEVDRELAVAEVERLGVTGQHLGDRPVRGAVGIDPQRLERRAGGEAVGGRGDEAVHRARDRPAERLQGRREPLGRRSP